MLCFTRRKNEGFWLEIPGQEPVHVVIINVDRGRVEVGVAAERSVAIFRDEVYVNVLRQRAEAEGTKRNGDDKPCPKPLPAKPPLPPWMSASQE